MRKWCQAATSLTLSFLSSFQDYSVDFAAPDRSPVLSAAFLGGNGDAADDFCVNDGLVANWTMLFPFVHCLARDFGATGQLVPWTPPEWQTHLLQAYDYFDEFRERVEHSVHYVVHAGLGGANLRGEMVSGARRDAHSERDSRRTLAFLNSSPSLLLSFLDSLFARESNERVRERRSRSGSEGVGEG